MLIQKMDNQARGITYYNGKIVFVNNALPKEDVEIQIILDKKRYSVASVTKYNTLAPNRISPKCKYYDICGGCQLEHISYQDELEYKKNYLNDIFRELNIKIDKIVNCNDYGYRNKITLKVNNNKIGYNKLNSGEIISINKCLIANKLINEKIKYLGYIDKNTVTDVIIKSFNNKVMLVLNGENNTDTSMLINHFDTIYINDKLVNGEKITATINNVKYYIAPNSFFQVNISIARKMFDYIKELCISMHSKNVLDLYCGCGSISLYIADIVDYVYGVELNKQSIIDANENKLLNNINNVEFIRDTTDNIENIRNFDTMILDPPRSGLSKKIIDKIFNSNIKNIIYVSCDPITLRRDLLLLKDRYSINSITTFDMFPNTYHVENVCTLSLK